MSCRRLLACLVVLWTTTCGAETGVASPHAIDIPKWFTESFLELADDVRDAAKADKRLLLYFGQDGCPYCTALMQVNFSQRDIASFTQKHFVAVALNIWGDREVTWLDGRKLTEKALASELKVQFTPTLLFFDEQGKVVLRLNGYTPPDKFRAALGFVAERREKRERFADFLATQATTAGTGKLITEPWFLPPPHDLMRIFATRGKPVMVLVEHAQCKECIELHTEGLKRPDVRKLVDGMRVVQIDLMSRRELVAPSGARTTEAAWARELGVTYVPSMIFFDAAGKEVFRNEGYLRPFHLASTINYVASGAYLKEPNLQRYIQQRADAMRAKGDKVDLWE